LLYKVTRAKYVPPAAGNSPQVNADFRDVTKADAMPPQDPARWRAHDMELLGPSLQE
jgi:hypothetical protein